MININRNKNGKLNIYEHKNFRKFLCWAVVYGLLFAAGWYGMDFSPSFTLMLLEVGLGVSLLGLLLSVREKTYALGETLLVLSFLFDLPAVFIYAVGDDYLNAASIGAFVGGVCMVLLLQWRKGGSALRLLGRFLIWAATCFTLLSGWSSTALIPYGIGLVLQGIAWELPVRGRARWVLYGLGFVGAVIFSVAPTIF